MYNKKVYKIMLFSVLIGSFFLITEPVFADAPICDGILTQEAYDFINKILNWVQILVPALLIVLGGVDFGTAVMGDDKDGLKKAGSRFVKRCICAVAVFFVPLIVNVLLKISGIVDEKGCVKEDVVTKTEQQTIQVQ